MSPEDTQPEDIGALLTASYQNSALLAAQTAETEELLQKLKWQQGEEAAYRDSLLAKFADAASRTASRTSLQK